MSVFIGVDPGLSGALVAIDSSGAVVEQLVMPRVGGTKGPLDTKCILSWLLDVNYESDSVYLLGALERVSTRPGQSAVSTLTTGVNWGRIDALFVSLGIRYETPTPQQWKRTLGLPKRSGKERAQGKLDAVEMVKRLFPDMNLMPGKRTTPHDGLADAVLIAEYARRKLG
jgi:crossover junction endodeoxyribonuclease RuvC